MLQLLNNINNNIKKLNIKYNSNSANSKTNNYSINKKIQSINHISKYS